MLSSGWDDRVARCVIVADDQVKVVSITEGRYGALEATK